MVVKAGIKNESYKHIRGVREGLYDSDSIFIRCAANSFAAFVLFLEADGPFVAVMSDASAFSIYPERPVLRISAGFEGLGGILVGSLGYMEDDSGVLRADCIEFRDYVHAPSDEPMAFWCEAGIPGDTCPGIYNGSIRIYSHRLFGKETLVRELFVSLEIVDVVLPAPRDYIFHLDLWQHVSNISRKHDVRLFSQAHFEVLDKYTASMARLGQKAITIIATDIPWSGQRTFNDLDEPTDLFEYGMIASFKASDGSFSYDYSVMDRYIELCFYHGIDRTIEVFGLCGIWMTEENGFGKPAVDFPDGVRIRYYDEASHAYSYMESAAQIRHFIRSLHDHFTALGLLEKVRIIADEPDVIERYRATVAVIREEGPGFRFSIGINKAEFTTGFNEVMSDAIPSLKCLANDYEFINENLIGREGKRICWYVCCRPHFPNTFLKSHLLESRFICILTSILGLDGFLRWNYTVWPEKPRERLIFRSPAWLAGDMNFVYPGYNGAPLLSMRYKALLRGIEDFELMAMAKNAGHDLSATMKSLLMGGTSLAALSESGYDESEPSKPFSTDEKDYEEFRGILYGFLA